MKEKIERLSKGLFEYEVPSLIVSETSLDLVVEAGIKKEGTIRIANEAGQRMKGVLYVTGKILVLSRMDFIGAECEVDYIIDASALQPGEEQIGTINIVSDCGECQIPYRICVAEPSFQSSVGTIKDLFQFANLARTSWREALELFGKDDFSKVILQNEPGYHLAYEQLVQSQNLSQALEEFLVLVHKKKPCDFYIEIEKMELEAGAERFMETLTIKKDQWGYLKLQVFTEAAFLSLSKKEFEAEDFVNGQVQLDFVVEAEKLCHGVHFAELIISSGKKTVRLPVQVRSIGAGGQVQLFQKNMHRLEYQLTKQYLDFRKNEITVGSFLAESSRLTESVLALLDKQEMESADPAVKAGIEERRYRYELYQAYLSIVDEKKRMGQEAYDQIFSKKSYFERNYRVFYCAVLYLETMKYRSRELVEQYAGIIRNFYEQDKRDDLLLWFLLYMDKRLESNKALRYETIRKHCQNGSTSPVLLYEAAVLWNAEPMLISSLSKFECQVMNYMVDNHLAGKEVALQFSYLCEKKSEQEKLQIRILKKLYGKFQHKDMLLVLCKKLICADVRKKNAHAYFRQGVREQLKLERLYEYYLLTLDKSANQLIDQQVLLYFGLSDFPSEEDAAFVYSYVVRNKDSNPAIYRAYLKRMEQFAVNQMKAGVISEAHAVLYADVLRKSIIDREMAYILPELIFMYQMECTNPKMKSVCVAHKEEKTAKQVPLTVENGVGHALISIYTEHAEIFLLDEQGNRYLMSEKDKLYRLMHAENFLDACYELGSDNRKLLLHIWEKSKDYSRQDSTLIELLKQISELEGIREEIKNSCIVSLVAYYHETYNIELLESYLNAVELRLLSAKDREKVLELMIIRDMYDKVMESVELFGCATSMQAKRLSKLCVRGIHSGREEKDRAILLTIGMFAFQHGQVEDRLLQYLVDRYNGTTGEMYDLWKAAKSRGLETMSLEERLLAQMLFAESYVEDSFSVFASYYGSGMNRKLIRAYFSYCAYKYFVRGRMTNPEFFVLLKKESFLENSQICILAMLKYYSEQEELTNAEREFVAFHIQKFVQKKLIFGFYKEFEGKITLPARMLDKYYVEYRANPKSRLVLHYSCRLDETEFREEEMKDAGYGIFEKELILFYGESLQYFITEETEHGIEIVESRIVNLAENAMTAGTTKYGKINEILLTQNKQDEKTLYALLERYYKEEYAVKRHFSPV